jgi:hypothetical protein
VREIGPIRGIDAFLQQLVIPDLWQQQAVRALREGKDVVVHAPTGAGKTFIFELLSPSLRGQSIFTVPTRALANDKLSEWRAKGWDVGLSTGDLCVNLDAKVVVATLETQKGKFLSRRGPALLVVDEYQMIGDAVRGVNYELALALAPATTQLLLLSGSVANSESVVEWLRRIGRQAVLISHGERPVPLEEVDLLNLPQPHSSRARGDWPRWITNALHADLGPVLLFAPRRNAAEELARQLAAALPQDAPLHLTPEQQALAGPALARLLAARVAYHHSGLSYRQRAGLIEPLAKNGQLRAVVATMGLAAGINFSMRSVAVTGTHYKAGHFERQVQPDELLQMYGRAGRRGLDECGYALVGRNPPRLHDARARPLRRATPLDWPTLIAVMKGAWDRGDEPFEAAMEVNRRLFSPVEIPLGVEHSRLNKAMPCGLLVDMERARFVRRGIVEIPNSRGVWEPRGDAPVSVPLAEAKIWDGSRWRPALSSVRSLEGVGFGNFCKLHSGQEQKNGEPDEQPGWIYGREVALGTRTPEGRLKLAPWLKRRLHIASADAEDLERRVLPELKAAYLEEARGKAAPGGASARTDLVARLTGVFPRDNQLVSRWSFEVTPVSAWRDSHGAGLIAPPERQNLPPVCVSCPELVWCRETVITQSPAHSWRTLGLIERSGAPTRRGILFSFFHHGEGLAIAAALEDESYPIEDLVFDLANLRAGPRFAGEDSPFGGRLGMRCQQTYERADCPGYLEMGVPVDYGAGASEVIREMVVHQTPRQKLLSEALRQGDLERALVEWRSLLRQVVWAPEFPWPRWRDLQAAAKSHIESSQSPTETQFPALTAAQQRRER